LQDQLSLPGSERPHRKACFYGRRIAAILPVPGGLLLWGSTVEGDMLCLKPGEGGRWTVSVSVGDWFKWLDYDLDFSDWLHFALTSQSEEWLPEWEPLPHTVVEQGPNPFGVTSMGAGPAGASL
jgi:hypothetical protein